MSTEAKARRPPVDDGLILLGLVGRAGSGKSTVARTLAAGGARVIEADALGHEVTDEDPEVRAALVAEYGPDVYRSDGTLERAKVAARVFQDPEARSRLDRLVHPRIIDRIRARISALRAEGFRGIVVLDAALLLDWGLESEMDAVLAVVADEEELVKRLVRSRGWPADEARRRLAVQRPRGDFEAAANVTIENRGTLEDLVEATRVVEAGLIMRQKKRLAAGKGPC